MESLVPYLSVREKKPREVPRETAGSIKKNKIPERLWDCLFIVVVILPAVFCVMFSTNFFQMALLFSFLFGLLFGFLQKSVFVTTFAFIAFFSFIFGPFMFLDYIWNYFWNYYPEYHFQQNVIGIIVVFGVTLVPLVAIFLYEEWGKKGGAREQQQVNNDYPESDYSADYSNPTFTMTCLGGRWGGI